jgi:hypothetical protein
VTVGPLEVLPSGLLLKAASWGVLVVVVLVVLPSDALPPAAVCAYCSYSGSEGFMMLTTPLVSAGTAEVGTVSAGTVVVVTPVRIAAVQGC